MKQKHHRYFLGALPHSEMAKVYEVIVGTLNSQRPTSKNNRIWVKLPIGDTKKHACLSSFKEYTYEEMSEKILEDEFHLYEDGDI
jgi:hypothetical protein